MKPSIKSAAGSISVIAAAVMWGCIGIFTRNLYGAGFSSMQIVAARAVITTVVTAVIILMKDKSLFKISFRDLWIFFAMGVCSYFFFNFFYMNSIRENSLSVACILLYTSPFWVTLASVILFKDKITVIRIVALVICFGGAVMLCMSDGLRITKAGLLYGALSGFGYALYSIFGKFAVEKYNSLTSTFYTFVFASIAAVPFCNVAGLISLSAVPRNVLFELAIAIISTALPYIFYTYGMSAVGIQKASVISIAEPVTASVVGVLAYKESLGAVGIIGIVTVTVGLILIEYRPKGKDNR